MIRTIDVVDLGGPKQKEDEEVTTRKEGDEKDNDPGDFVSSVWRPMLLKDLHCSPGFGEHLWRAHGIFGEPKFVHKKGDDKDQPEDERHQDVHTTPSILFAVRQLWTCMLQTHLLPSPLHSHHET